MTPDGGNTWPGSPAGASGPLIERYEGIARLSRDMLTAAHREDWVEVARLGACCRALIDDLKRAALAGMLNEVEEQRRIELLREILHDDAQIRLRAEPWLVELEQLLGLRGRCGPPD